MEEAFASKNNPLFWVCRSDQVYFQVKIIFQQSSACFKALTVLVAGDSVTPFNSVMTVIELKQKQPGSWKLVYLFDFMFCKVDLHLKNTCFGHKRASLLQTADVLFQLIVQLNLKYTCFSFRLSEADEALQQFSKGTQGSLSLVIVSETTHIFPQVLTDHIACHCQSRNF